MAILVTGGTGFIGSHTVVELLNANEKVIIVDNLKNSKKCVLDRIESITGKRPAFYQVDLLDREALDRVFAENPDIAAVIHFAGLKAVGESVEKPLLYYHDNLTTTFHLLECMEKHGVNRIVFSSTATVYGLPKSVPISEDFPLSTESPYAESKRMIERVLQDACHARPSLSALVLRYFNPIGAHESGLIGEDPKGIPNNLLPYVAKVAAGKLPVLRIFGNDYPTRDGTGVRDYIHVVDLALAHLCALARTEKMAGIEYYNIGTGTAYSVLEVVNAFGRAWGSEIPYEFTERRSGDIAEYYANPTKAYEMLSWRAERDLAKMCEDAARWQRNNPDGYPDD